MITYQTGWGFYNDQQYRLVPYLGSDQSQVSSAFNWTGSAADSPDRALDVLQCPKLVRRWVNGNDWRVGKRACYGMPYRLAPHTVAFDPVPRPPVYPLNDLPRDQVLFFDSLNYGVWAYVHFNWWYYENAAHGVTADQFHLDLSLNFLYTDLHAQPHADADEPGNLNELIFSFGQ